MIHQLQDIFETKRVSANAEPIVLCAADDNYAKPLTVMLQSAAENLQINQSMTAIVLDGGITDENKMALKESLADFPIEVFTISPGLEDVRSLGISHHITHTAYLRLLAGRLLPETVDKVIYLDSDLLVLDDISKLWEYPLNNEFALAVPDVACPFVDVRHADCNFAKSSPYLAAISPISNWKNLGLDPSAPYFNSGVMVLNIKKMRDEKIEQRLLDCLNVNSEFVWCWDQYALNVVFSGQWNPLPLKWNQGAHFFEFPNEKHSPLNQEEFVEARDNPSIVHFTTEWKPWDFENKHPLRSLFYEQLDKTAWAKWRPTKPPFKLAKIWQKTATQIVKHSVICYRKIAASFQYHQSLTPVEELPRSRNLTLPKYQTLDFCDQNTLKNQLTIFAVPKAFEGPDKISQMNAIRSWKRFCSFADIVLLGDERGIAEAAQKLGVKHIAGIPTNSHGTPLLSAVFEKIHKATTTPFLAYCNSDIILFDDFEESISRLITAEEFDQFMATGKRTNLKLGNLVDFDSNDEIQSLRQKAKNDGRLDSIVCKDYFVFTRGVVDSMPQFAVGRGNWDNWMIHHAKTNKIPIVRLGDSVMAVHQDHDHAHAGSRLQSYATGVEARENQKLAGGRHLISGSTSDYSLRDGQLIPTRMKSVAAEFWRDFANFARLLFDFVGRK